jgi:hypothetical protein
VRCSLVVASLSEIDIGEVTNYIRPNEGLGGRTPSEMAGIKVEGENKWITLIQNSAKGKRSQK